MTTATKTSIFSPNAQYLLCTRGYAHKGPNHPICPFPENHHGEEVRHETHDEIIMRVGMGNWKYEALLEQNLFAPNSPAWFNLPCKVCGQDKVQGTCSACFKFDVADTMDSILDVTRKAGLVLKAGVLLQLLLDALIQGGDDELQDVHRLNQLRSQSLLLAHLLGHDL